MPDLTKIQPSTSRVWKDPRLVRAARGDVAPGKILFMGIDLGTDCGFAFAEIDPDKPIDWSEIPVFTGRFDISAGEYESGALRILKLKRFLQAVSPDFLCYEQIRNTPGLPAVNKFNVGQIVARVTTAAQFAGALMGVAALWAEERGVPCAAIPIGTIKKRATDKGNASKEDVARACNAVFGTAFDIDRLETTGDHNTADAVWVTVCGAEQYAPGFAKGIYARGSAAGPPDAGEAG